MQHSAIPFEPIGPAESVECTSSTSVRGTSAKVGIRYWRRLALVMVPVLSWWKFSVNANPMPWATPPSIWPRTCAGLMMPPASVA